MGDVCILIPTFEKYRAIAAFTRAKLDEYWPAHPPLFFCGLAGEALAGGELLELRDDPADWMALVRSAGGDLRQRGFAKCYLILDDHPPLGRCHARHLNETLPALMDELSAATLALLGWGQHRVLRGEMLNVRGFQLERCAPDDLWKFSLHPALWDLRALADLLDRLLAAPDLRERTCWKFERRAGDENFPLPPHLRDASYRISGAEMTAQQGATFFAAQRAAELFAFDVFRFGLRIFAGQKARDHFDARWLGPYHFYDGPYPLFWSGIMKKGRLHPDLPFFLRLHRRLALLAELRRAIAVHEAAAAR